MKTTDFNYRNKDFIDFNLIPKREEIIKFYVTKDLSFFQKENAHSIIKRYGEIKSNIMSCVITEIEIGQHGDNFINNNYTLVFRCVKR